MTVLLAEKPDHVPAELVVDFDLFHVPAADEDVHAAYRDIQLECPPIFWTPRHNGHWVVTRAADMEVVLRDSERFSSERITVPRMSFEELPRMLPIELDPPAHAPYRRPLTAALLPQVVRQLQGKVHEITRTLVDGLAPRGECEFVRDFAQILPIFVFLDLVDLPRADRETLLPVADRATRNEDRDDLVKANIEFGEYLAEYVKKRRIEPGTDLLSRIVNIEIDGRRISDEEAQSYAKLILVGGLDTVTSTLGFVARLLALRPDLRTLIRSRLDDEAFLRKAAEELLRRNGVSTLGRTVRADMEFNGVFFRKGDFIMNPTLLGGLDDARFPDPMEIDFDRPTPLHHTIFGAGAHNCPGAPLARRELIAFLQEWLFRIPDFSIRPGTRPVMETGGVNGVRELHLVWTPGEAGQRA